MMEKKSAFKAIREAVKKQEREGNQRLLATAAPIAATSLLKKYYDGRLRSGEAGSYGTPLEEHLDTAGKWAYHHPLVTGGAGVVGAHWALNAAKKLKLGI